MQQNNTDQAPSSTQPATSSSRAGSLTTWDSSDSFYSTAPDIRRADKVFDRIEDLLTKMMDDPEQRQFHCRVLEGHLDHEQPPKKFTAVIVIAPPVPKQ